MPETEALYACVTVAYRPHGWDNPQLPVYLRPGAEYAAGERIDPGRVPDWILHAWRSDGRVSATPPEDPPEPPADPKHYAPDPCDVLSRSGAELSAGTADRLRAIIDAVAQAEGVSRDESRIRVMSAISTVGEQQPIRTALEQSGVDVAAVTRALPHVQAERAQAATEVERKQWRDAVRSAA